MENNFLGLILFITAFVLEIIKPKIKRAVLKNTALFGNLKLKKINP
ncbi:hypothetical protein J2X31_001484 [Flavobacterium arsenatis]|uniref:Uncharacterized protein n=1 Tax=Flavobacterium arsenatis TaxID=1484332 RepID=A0ABU1TNM8_9FLAO|nr:hypothetical protein [Flavobacterium arsenatis]